ncbi:MAG: hypothetical protein H0V19_01135, partial [Euzebyales bacterium]|nr:hypothetical protein [Euzebyales bacterium]
VVAGAILGVFCSPWPDRVVFVYEGRPRGGGEPVNGPPAHEIDAVAWVDVDDALRRLAPYVAEQVRRCLVEPGGTWIQAVGG